MVQSSWANNTLSDVASTFNLTLPRDGQAPMSAQLKIVDGSVTVPGIAFNSDPATGLFRPIANSAALAVSGAEILRAKSNGAVLVGTTTDNGTSKLQVNGDVLATTFTGTHIGNVTGNVTGNLTGNVTGNVTGAASLNVLKAGDTMTGLLTNTVSTGINLILNSSTAGGSYAQFANSGTPYGYIGSGAQLITGGAVGDLALRTANNFYLGLGGSPAVTVLSSGNVGVGTTSPNKFPIARALTINQPTVGSYSGIEFATAETLTGSVVSASNELRFTAHNNLSAAIQTFYTGGIERLRLDSAGNLGLGMSPSAWGATYKAIQVGNTALSTGSTTTGFLRVNNYYNGTTDVSISGGPTATFGFDSTKWLWYSDTSSTAGAPITQTQRMNLDSAGNLHTSSASGSGQAISIDVTNSQSGAFMAINATGTTFSAGGIGGSTALLNTGANTNLAIGNIGTGSGVIQFCLNNAERMRLDSNGNLGIGGTVGGNERLYVATPNGTQSVIRIGQASQRDWYVGLPASSPNFTITDASAGAVRLTLNINGDVGIGTTTPNKFPIQRALTINAPSAGNYSGIEFSSADTMSGSLVSSNFETRLSSVGSAFTSFYTNNAERLRITGAGVIQDAAGNELGYKGIPPVSNAWVPGQCNVVTAGTTINTGGVAGATYSLLNNSASAITLTQGSGLTLRQGGTVNTGNRTILPNGIATIWFLNSTTAYIQGAIT